MGEKKPNMVGKRPIWVKKDQYFIKKSRFYSGSTIQIEKSLLTKIEVEPT
jgi:hypothetical protein